MKKLIGLSALLLLVPATVALTNPGETVAELKAPAEVEVSRL